MFPFFSKKIKENLTSVHLVQLGGCSLQFLTGIILIAISLSLASVAAEVEKALEETNSRDSGETSSNSREFNGVYDLLMLQRKMGVAYAIPLLLVSLGGILAYGAFNKTGAIVHIVFSALSVVYGLICIVVPLFESAIIGTTCTIAQEMNDDTGNVAHLICVTLRTRMDAVTVLIAIGIVICFVVSILGCVGVRSMGNYSRYVGEGYTPAVNDAYTQKDPNHHVFSQPLMNM